MPIAGGHALLTMGSSVNALALPQISAQVCVGAGVVVVEVGIRRLQGHLVKRNRWKDLKMPVPQTDQLWKSSGTEQRQTWQADGRLRHFQYRPAAEDK